MDSIPVIDLFAGPGGLGEGFSAFSTGNAHSQHKPFKIKLSIEKDPHAHKTLQLRSFYRQFQTKEEVPEAYYDFLRQAGSPEEGRRRLLFGNYEFRQQVENVHREARLLELGKHDASELHKWIIDAIGGHTDWVLIGGPPCQAYSVVGRSRNKGNKEYVPEDDVRQYLYIEYLQILADYKPAMFVMENVKGLLSATLKNQRVFQQICEDLSDPETALRLQERETRNPRSFKHYKLYPCVREKTSGQLSFSAFDDLSSLSDFVVKMEKYGIPQSRHRIIILGVRDDINVRPGTLRNRDEITTGDAIRSLPRLRSGISRQEDSNEIWFEHLKGIASETWLTELDGTDYESVALQIKRILGKLRRPRASRGKQFLETETKKTFDDDWFVNERIGGICNHVTREHIVEDLHRYLFAACYARKRGISPVLKFFPEALLPNHENAKDASKVSSGVFSDRFRVQVENRPSTTITSHISKDGHYYIHYDPSQCRSLTVREAARIQTFPDDYFFCGSRTAQYVQVGNAVPPLLARQIAAIVYDVLQGIT